MSLQLHLFGSDAFWRWSDSPRPLVATTTTASLHSTLAWPATTTFLGTSGGVASCGGSVAGGGSVACSSPPLEVAPNRVQNTRRLRPSVNIAQV